VLLNCGGGSTSVSGREGWRRGWLRSRGHRRRIGTWDRRRRKGGLSGWLESRVIRRRGGRRVIRRRGGRSRRRRGGRSRRRVIRRRGGRSPRRRGGRSRRRVIRRRGGRSPRRRGGRSRRRRRRRGRCRPAAVKVRGGCTGACILLSGFLENVDTRLENGVGLIRRSSSSCSTKILGTRSFVKSLITAQF